MHPDPDLNSTLLCWDRKLLEKKSSKILKCGEKLLLTFFDLNDEIFKA